MQTPTAHQPGCELPLKSAVEQVRRVALDARTTLSPLQLLECAAGMGSDCESACEVTAASKARVAAANEAAAEVAMDILHGVAAAAEKKLVALLCRQLFARACAHPAVASVPVVADVPFACSLLEQLHRAPKRPALPIFTHEQRIPSGQRGLSLVFLRAIRDFYGAHGALHKLMGDVCKEVGSTTSVCALTRSTGLSLAENVVHAAAGRAQGVAALVGHASTFFSYR